jgi:hypothetical protein
MPRLDGSGDALDVLLVPVERPRLPDRQTVDDLQADAQLVGTAESIA